MKIPYKKFLEFKELIRKEIGEKAYSKMTELELLASATSLITLTKAVYRSTIKEDYKK